MSEEFWKLGRYQFPLNGEYAKPLVMGILNVTPDSFSDGGRYSCLADVIARAEQMVEEGVDIIDIGAESTRPGARPVPASEELDRVLPVIEALRDCGKPISIDTYKPLVMRKAIAAGVDMVNDVSGFASREAVEAVKDSDCALCVMHLPGDAASMHAEAKYADVTREVREFFHQRLLELQEQGIALSRICIDPGFGFGKSVDDNLALLSSIDYIKFDLSVPLLAGLSRKSLIGSITGQPVEKRLAGSIAAAIAAVAHGARIVRVHDVAETVDALKVWQAVAQ